MPARKKLPHRQMRKGRRKQAGGQLGAIASILGPIIAKEVIGGIVGAIKRKKKRKKGKGISVAGAGLRLAGQRGRGRHKRKSGK